MNEVALEALVHILKPRIQILGQQKNRRHSHAKTSSLLGSRTCFRCMKEGKVLAQPQLYGTSYFSVRIAPTGRIKRGVDDLHRTGEEQTSRHFPSLSTFPILLKRASTVMYYQCISPSAFRQIRWDFWLKAVTDLS